MRNTYKYTKLYSGAEPQFVEGDIFKTTVPLRESATATVGPASTTQVTTQDITERFEALTQYCTEPRSKKDMMAHLGLMNANHFRKTYLLPLLTQGKIKMTIPDKPNSRNQRYIKA